MGLKNIKILIVLLLFFASCKNDQPKNVLYGQLVFPDTIEAGKKYNLFIDYKNEEFDIKENNSSYPTYRMLMFYYTIDTISHSQDNVKFNIKDSVFSSKSDKININGIIIQNPGIRYITGVIKDNLYIDSLLNQKNPLLSGIIMESYLTKKVVVIE